VAVLLEIVLGFPFGIGKPSEVGRKVVEGPINNGLGLISSSLVDRFKDPYGF